ncbi:MAG: hypothetical protein HKN20_06445 [Gemmatimonadetes bacterium]|nr:hypothetical protein [Gemmatimonadota bacterium]
MRTFPFLLLLTALTAEMPGVIAFGGEPSVRLAVETGLQAGGAVRGETPAFSHTRMVSEIGLLTTRRRAFGSAARWDFGVVAYGALGGYDMRLGVKPKLRYYWSDRWSTDLSAGWIVHTLEAETWVSNTGRMASITANYGESIVLKLDLNVRETSEWPPASLRSASTRVYEAGTETALYGGVSWRNRAGWWATGAGTAVIIGLSLFVILSGGVS